MNDGSATPFGCTAGARPARRRRSRAVRRHRDRLPPTTSAATAPHRPPLSALRPRGTRASPGTVVCRDRGSRRAGLRFVGEPARCQQPQHRDTACGADDRGHDVHTVAPARDSTAAQPATPASTIAALPTGTRRVSHFAVIAATAAITASTSTDSTSLSAMPKVWMAHSLTGPGVRSMTVDPTAVRASDSGPTKAASSWVTPSATAAAAIPASALALARGHEAKLPMRPPERLTEK